MKRWIALSLAVFFFLTAFAHSTLSETALMTADDFFSFTLDSVYTRIVI